MDARQWARSFFQWYNQERRHSGIGLLMPAMVHRGHADVQVQARQQVLDRAYAAHPERFVRGRPIPSEVPSAVWINPPATASVSEGPPSYALVPLTGPLGADDPSNTP